MQYNPSADDDDNQILCNYCPMCRIRVKSNELYNASMFHKGAPHQSTADGSSNISNTTLNFGNEFTSQEMKDLLYEFHPDGSWNEWISSAKVDKMMEILLEIKKKSKDHKNPLKTVMFPYLM